MEDRCPQEASEQSQLAREVGGGGFGDAENAQPPGRAQQREAAAPAPRPERVDDEIDSVAPVTSRTASGQRGWR
jgi:hypothetical protein